MLPDGAIYVWGTIAPDHPQYLRLAYALGGAVALSQATATKRAPGNLRPYTEPDYTDGFDFPWTRV
jgi:hypothetical protein